MNNPTFARQFSDSSLIASRFPGFDGFWFNETIQESKAQIMRIVRDAQPAERSLAQLDTTLVLKPVTLESKRGKDLAQAFDSSWRSARKIREPRPAQPVQRPAEKPRSTSIQRAASPEAARRSLADFLMDFAGDVTVAIAFATLVASSALVVSVLAL